MSSLPLSGFVLVDKTQDVTSHAVVSFFRKTLGLKKIGHLGTLDPFATGLLPILIGPAARLSEYVMTEEKVYEFTIKLGEETDTLDSKGQVVKTALVPLEAYSSVEAVLKGFVGHISQVPPAYSALKYKGRPLYEYMRAQGSVPFDMVDKTRNVHIFSLELLKIDKSQELLFLRVKCGPGTYVRSLARDIAQALGTVGYCLTLRRSEIGAWRAKDALVFDKENLTKAQVLKHFKPFTKLLPLYDQIILKNEEDDKSLMHGQSILLKSAGSYHLGLEEKPVFVFNSACTCCFLSRIHEKDERFYFKPEKKIL
jgi:tRNA pseudouridine55 synthase